MSTAPTVLVLLGAAILVGTIVFGSALYPLLFGTASTKPISSRTSEWNRIDRDDVYVGVLIALWFAGLGIALVPIGQGVIATLPESTQKLLAICMMIGSSIALLGSASGQPALRITWPFRVLAKVIGRIVHRPTGPARVHNAYLMGSAGLVAFSISLLILALTIIGNATIIGAATGTLTPILFIAYTKKARKLFRESQRLKARFDELSEEVTREIGDP